MCRSRGTVPLGQGVEWARTSLDQPPKACCVSLPRGYYLGAGGRGSMRDSKHWHRWLSGGTCMIMRLKRNSSGPKGINVTLDDSQEEAGKGMCPYH